MTNAWTTALHLADRGFHVFPLGERGKTPIGKWKDDATSDRATVERWAATYPDNNYGVACGPSNLTVIDMDVKGINGIDMFEMACAANMPGLNFDEQFYVDTPSGGRHLYYRGTVDPPRS